MSTKVAQHLYYLLLGGIAGLIVGIIPCLIVFAVSNGAYAIYFLMGFGLVGAILGSMQHEKIEIFFDGLFEFITIG